MRNVNSAVAALLIMYSLPAAAIAAEPDVVKVTMRGRVQPTSDMIKVADVAVVEDGDLITRRKISDLDLAQLDENGRPSRISKARVKLRILLSDVAREAYTVTGPANTLLTVEKKKFEGVPSTASADRRILDFLRGPIASRLGVPPSDVLIRIVRPISDEHRQLLVSDSTLEHFLPASIRSEPQTVKIGFRKHDQLEKTMAVWLDVQVMRDVLVSNHKIESGATITEADVSRERRAIGGQFTKHVSTAAVGRTTRKAIPAGAILSDLDLRRTVLSRKEFVIRNRDTVEIVVRRNAVQVRFTGGLALQRGAVGDAIRVKNPNSGKIFTARVVDSGTVEIRL